MPKITFIKPDGSEQTVNAAHNHSIMQTALEHKIKGIEGICGGCIACATCHVHIHPDWVKRVIAEDNEQSEEEIDMLELADNRSDTSRLGCQIKLTDALSGLIVTTPDAKKP